MYWQAFAAGAQALKDYGAMPIQDFFNRKASSKAMKQNVLLWKMNNDYNKPVNQMARFKEAGLNPNLIYGQMNDAGAISANIPHNTPDVPQTNPVSQYIDLIQRDAMTQQIDAQTQLIEAQKAEAIARTDAINLENQENFENGTSRATPYPVRLGKSVVNEIKQPVSNFVNDVVDRYSDPYYKRSSKYSNSSQGRYDISVRSDLHRRFGGSDLGNSVLRRLGW